MSDLISIFNIDWKLLLAQTINFAVVMWLLSIVVVKPIRNMMIERQQKIEDGLDSAKRSQTVLLQANTEAKNIERDAQKIASDIRSQAQQHYTEKINNAKADAEHEKASIIASADIVNNRNHENMLKIFRAESVDIIIAGVRSMMNEKLVMDSHKAVFIETMMQHK